MTKIRTQNLVFFSGQMQGEYYACALSNIYTFGPTFRAENSHTSRHLAEFWMIEPEIAFCDLTDDMQCAEDYVRFCCQSILKTCRSVSIPSSWKQQQHFRPVLQKSASSDDSHVGVEHDLAKKHSSFVRQVAACAQICGQ